MIPISTRELLEELKARHPNAANELGPFCDKVEEEFGEGEFDRQVSPKSAYDLLSIVARNPHWLIEQRDDPVRQVKSVRVNVGVSGRDGRYYDFHIDDRDMYHHRIAQQDFLIDVLARQLLQIEDEERKRAMPQIRPLLASLLDKAKTS